MKLKKQITASLLAIMGVASAQSTDYKSASTKDGSNYYDIVTKTRSEFTALKKRGQSESLAEKKARKHFERWAFYWKNRVNSDGSFPSAIEGWYNAGIIDENGKIVSQSARTAPMKDWVNVGPQSLPNPNSYPFYPQLGRLNTFWRYEHTDPNQDILLVGAPAGGVWKSTDNGETWAPKLDQIAGIGVTDIKSTSSDASTPGTIYISTGDYDGRQINSIGVYKSTDLGETFTPTGLTFSLEDEERLSNLVVYDDGTIIVGVKSGILKSTDGGDTWNAVYEPGFELFIGRFSSYENYIIATGAYNGIYFSDDKGSSWKVIQELQGDEPRYSATSVQVTDGEARFYILSHDGKISLYTPSETTPELQQVAEIPAEYDTQGGYNQVLYVGDSLNFVGTVEGLTSNDGEVWNKSMNGYWQDESDPGVYVHSDHHAFGELDDKLSFYDCNDGGLTFVNFNSSEDTKPTVTYKSSRVLVTQSYSVAITPQNEDFFLIGNQDNDGFSREVHEGKTQWISAVAGDGTATAIDYSNSNIRYLGSVNGGLRRVTEGFSDDPQGTELMTPEGAEFIWPLILHSTTPTTLFGGFSDIFKSTDKGDNWTNLNAGAGTVSFIETFDENLYIVGESGSKKSFDGGATWSDISAPAGQTINSISASADKNIIYASTRGYNDGEKVYKSTDGGASWSNISAGLPNVTINQVKVFKNQNDEVLFAGTELGVYMKKNENDWVKFGNGLPNVIINDLEINYTAEKLVIATFGRGIWQIDITDIAVGLAEDISKNDDAPIVLGNPITNGNLKIKVRDNKNYSYSIYNTIGGNIGTGVLNQEVTNVNLSGVVDGTYLVKMKNDNNQIVTRKVIIKN